MRRLSFWSFITLSGFLSLGEINQAFAQEDFKSWLEKLQAEAKSLGISPQIVSLLDSLTFDPKVIELDRKQPEVTKTLKAYLQDGERIRRLTNQAKDKLRESKALLGKIQKTYKVPIPYILALWGIESNFGRNMGNFHVLRSLASLSYDGRRGEFFRNELLEALKIIQAGHVRFEDMRGSWAGAMGQCQFLPSNFQKFAIDYNQDGKGDIWHNKGDVFASIANYLAKNGWTGYPEWGIAVKLPPGFDLERASFNNKPQPLVHWHKLGLKLEDGRALPLYAWPASLLMPDGPNGPAFLVNDNFQVLLKWNKSYKFAISVGLLADSIRKG